MAGGGGVLKIKRAPPPGGGGRRPLGKIQRALRQSVGLQSPGRWNFVSGETFECCIVVFKRSNRPSSQEAAVTLL